MQRTIAGVRFHRTESRRGAHPSGRFRAGRASVALFFFVLWMAPECSLSAQTIVDGGEQPSTSDETRSDRRISYDQEFFAEFRPNTALDMIQRIPGFSYDRGDTDVRGLTGASGNVLIDGQRPSTKSLNLDDVMRRIPVASVARIEIIQGSAAGVDMQGQSVVANIVRNPGGVTAIAAELMTKYYTDHRPAAIARLEGSRSGGPLSFEGALSWRQEKDQGASGVGRLDRRGPTGLRSTSGRFEADWDRSVAGLNGAAEYRSGPDFVRLSVSGERDRQDRQDLAALIDVAGSRFTEAVATEFASDQGVASLDYERELSSLLTLRLLGLESRERDRSTTKSTSLAPPQVSTEKSLSGESILRAGTTYLPTPTVTVDASIERAFNFLDARSTLERGGAPVDLPSASVRIEERRVEAAGSVRWRAWPDGTLEAGLAYETSTIAQRGDFNRSESLQFLKPRFNATLDPLKGWQLRLRVERTVSQLDFDDFASTASLDTGTVNAGNPDLIPEQAWVFEAAIERRFWERGAVTLTASHAVLSDVIDLTPIEGRFDAPGNIGDGIAQEAKLSLSLPLERLGVRGALIRFNGTWRRSTVIDPVTLDERRISRQRPFDGDLSVTKDLPGLRSVVAADIFFGYRETSYRLNEIRIERSSSEPLAKIYWDWTPRPGTAFRFQIENITFRSRSRDRILYDGPRSAGRIRGYERREAILDPFLMVRLRESF